MPEHARTMNEKLRTKLAEAEYDQRKRRDLDELAQAAEQSGPAVENITDKEEKMEADQLIITYIPDTSRQAEVLQASREPEGPVLFYHPVGFHGHMLNWFKAEMTIEDTEYDTVERYIMAEKAKLFGDTDTLKQIMGAEKGMYQVKKLGRTVSGFDDKVWRANRDRILTKAVESKYRQNPKLKKKLSETGERRIGEATQPVPNFFKYPGVYFTASLDSKSNRGGEDKPIKSNNRRTNTQLKSFDKNIRESQKFHDIYTH